jgi:hypothetical protein
VAVFRLGESWAMWQPIHAFPQAILCLNYIPGKWDASVAKKPAIVSSLDHRA